MASGESLGSRLARGVDVTLPRWKVAGWAMVPVLIEIEVTAETKQTALEVGMVTLAGAADEVVEVKDVRKMDVRDWKPTAISVPPRRLVNHHCMPVGAPKFVCQHCGSLFPFVVSVKCARRPKFCGDTCRMKAWRLKKRADKLSEEES